MSGSTGAGPRAAAREGRAGGSESAGRLLDRALPEGYREEWARLFAQADGDVAAEGEQLTVVLFRIGEEWLALPTGLFYEVGEPRRCHSLPHRRDNLVLGIVNVRGELLVCVSLATLLGISEGPAERGGAVKSFPRLVVIGRDGRRVAFPVDEVHGVHHYHAGEAIAVPATIGRSGATFATALIAWQGRTVGLLDETLILETLDRSIT